MNTTLPLIVRKLDKDLLRMLIPRAVVFAKPDSLARPPAAKTSSPWHAILGRVFWLTFQSLANHPDMGWYGGAQNGEILD